ncbi:MAG: ABC transporter ATP-binding protein [Bdellovibrionia bacterium]
MTESDWIPSPTSGALQVQGLRKKIGSFILDAEFTIESAQRAVLFGASGSGKTTLLRILAGVEPMSPKTDAGRVTLAREDITFQAPRLRQIGVVFQDCALFPQCSVLQNAVFALRMRGVPREAREALGLQWLERVDLKSYAHKGIEHLSGGEKQRLAFVRALIWKPRLLLLDEPFSALDIKMRNELRKQLLNLHQVCEVPLLLVTHDELDLERIGTFELRLSSDKNSPIRVVRRG